MSDGRMSDGETISPAEWRTPFERPSQPATDADGGSVIDIAEGDSLDLLQAIYRDPTAPLARRMRAAIAALPFERPKLAVTAMVGPNAGFAARLEAACHRSGRTLLIEHKNEGVPQNEPDFLK